MKTFKIPVEWSVYAIVDIEAETIEDAIKKFHETEDDIPLPTDSEYIDGSFKISCDEDEEVEYTKLINGMDNTYFA